MKIFCDGVWDLFHYGHVNHFKKIKNLFPDCYLLVGVLNDKDATIYKRKPIFDENKRKELLDSCEYVDENTIEFPLVMTNEFMEEHDIDLVVHAFSNENDYDKQKEFFKVPIELNKFLKIEYDKTISTTKLIEKMNL